MYRSQKTWHLKLYSVTDESNVIFVVCSNSISKYENHVIFVETFHSLINLYNKCDFYLPVIFFSNIKLLINIKQDG